MLKSLKPDTYAGMANAKCGEIYFQSLHSFRIDCAFCEMKSFVFGDFLLHVQNVHFENGLLKTEAAEAELKQERDQASPVPIVAQVNPFAWYEIGGDHDDDDSEDAEVAMLAGLDEEDERPGGAIMKWDNSGQLAGSESLRQVRALKVDYKEEDSEREECGLELDHDRERDLDPDSLGSETQSQSRQACPHCSKSYQSRKTLERHLLRQHRGATAAVEPDSEDADYEPPKEKAGTQAQEHKCEHCGKVYHGKYSLRQHLKREHSNDNDEGGATSFTCLECEAELPRLRLLDEHMVQAHGGAACVVCGRRYKTRHELKRHQLKHTSERNVPCTHPGCGKRFFTIRHMRNHGKVHTEQKNFVCESCGYSCRNKETLRVHIRSHTGERPFGCQVCDKRFPSHSGLREHMAMHSTERPHVCGVCGATFSRQKGLYHHKFLHADTKQFVCKLCGNAYAQAAGLAGHMRKHRNDELNG